MTPVFAYVAAALAILTSVGWAVLSPLRDLTRRALLPAAPLFGVAFLAAVISSTSWFLSVRSGVWVAIALAAAVVCVAVLRGRRPWRLGVVAAGLAALTLVIGMIGGLVALIPSFWVGDGRAMSPNPSHDVYYYVAESAWLQDHPISPPPNAGAFPGLGNSVPAFAPMAASLRVPLRIGQPMVSAALDTLTGTSAIASAMAVTALWVLLVAPSAFVAARLLRVRRGPALAVALVSVTSALLLQQAYQQNTDALLGVGLALLTLAACVAAAESRIPVWPAAVALAGLVGVYTEVGVFVGPAIIAGILLRRPRGAVRRLQRAAVVVGLAVLLAPTAWARGVGTLLVRRDGDALDSPLFSDGWYPSLGRVVGTSSLAGAITPSRATVVLVALLVAGWLLAVVLDRYRGAWSVLLASGLGYVTLLTVGHHGYSQLRAVSLLMPLLLFTSGAGWAAGLRQLRGVGRGRRVLHMALAVCLVLSVAVWARVNVRSAPAGLDRAYAESRHVDLSFDEAASWVADVGVSRGADVTVLAPDLFDQMWLAYALRQYALVSYVSLRPDYLGTGSYWAGESDRYLVIGKGAALDAPSAGVVESNGRFTLIDTKAGAVVAAVPTDAASWYPFAVGHAMVGPDEGRFTIVRSAGVSGAVDLELAVPAETRLVDVVVEQTGRSVRAEAVNGRVSARVDLGSLSTAIVRVDLDGDGVTSHGQFGLEGVSHVG